MKKVVIVDDESSGRKLIKEYLEFFPDLIIIGEANNGVDAVKLINKFKPDLVFIDIQMPGLNGFEVLEKIEEFPIIIFSTAYDKYALKAFEANATDYLLKPYTKSRFDTAISKINFDNTKKIADLAEEIQKENKSFLDRIIVQKSKKYYNISVDGINTIEAYGDYSKIITNEDNFISNTGIGDLEKRLNPKYFIRVHRSSIVNWSKVIEIDRLGKSFVLLLENSNKVRVSRNYANLIKEKII